MNARLQVEHPVTELVTGADLVAPAAADRRRRARCPPSSTGDRRATPSRRGWWRRIPTTASCRRPGTLLRFDLPDGVRVDAGYRAGQEVPTTFDGLLAKLIAHGADRAEALDRLAAALDADGRARRLQTNLPLLRALVADPDVRAGRLDTTLLERPHAAGRDAGRRPPPRRAARALQARDGPVPRRVS